MLRLGLVGLGEVGVALARDLLSAGYSVRAFDDRGHASSQSAAEKLGIELDSTVEAFTAAVETVFVAVPGSEAATVGTNLAGALTSGATYVDISARSVEVRDLVARRCLEHGIAYVDCALMYLWPGEDVDIMFSGPGASSAAEVLSPTRWKGTRLGEQMIATEIKLCRSTIVKGLTALLFESLVAAETLGVGREVAASIDRFLGEPFGRLRVAMMTSTIRVHSERRAHELADAAVLVTSALGAAPMSSAAARVLGAITRLRPILRDSADLQSALSTLARSRMLVE